MRSTFQLIVLIAATTYSPMLWAQSTTKPAEIKNAKLGATKNVHRADDLFFAGQFGPSDLEEIKKQAITRVITLRTDGEIDWNEQRALESEGIDFIKVPFRSPESLTDEVFDKIRKLLKDRSKKTLFHCGSANRVGGVWLPFRVLDEKVELKTALAEAKKIGLRTPFIEKKAIDYIKRQQSTAPAK